MLAFTAAAPLIVALALVTQQQEEQAISQALKVQQTIATILGHDVETYLRLHEAAVVTFATEPDLLLLAPQEQVARLREFHDLYPDFAVVQLFNANGDALLRTDGRALSPSARGRTLFEQARTTGEAVLAIERGQVIPRPLVYLSAPINLDGQFTGVVVAAIETSRMAEVLDTARLGADTSILLVDATGRLIAAANAQDTPILSNVSDRPAVGAMQAATTTSGILRYRDAGQEQLASYARLNEPGWGLIVERPTVMAIATVHAGRELAFVFLLLMVGASIAGGSLLARQLTRPLSTLAHAAHQFATNEAVVPLPNTAIAELAHLTAIFRMMREQLLHRTAERDRLLEAERAARQGAEEAVQIRETFLAVASHELKTPLTALMGQVQLLQRRVSRDSTLNERDQRSLSTILEQCWRLNQLISTLLDLSRIQTGRLTIDPQPFDLAHMVRQVVTEVQPTLRQHHLSYTGTGGPLVVTGDPVRLEQVLRNLLQNAVKYSPGGGTISVRLEQQPSTVYLAVTDPGIGIPAAALPQLFTRFYRAGNVHPFHISGLGIGLFIVKEIITLHGGTIAVESQEGLGSTFTISLPASASVTLREAQAMQVKREARS